MTDRREGIVSSFGTAVSVDFQECKIDGKVRMVSFFGTGFLRMQDRREGIEEPSPGLEFVKGNWHSEFFFNNCSAFLY
ncbi:unnamed protein product [Rhizophagus irregularis]|uniref:Uncharacterized protein n=1 Tax=Rhizophagus irregularis TaxID=588596 RepID=A0A915ZC23_9GLOM|nr:unnamed protein product [Rhizophagus irregularis]